MAGPKICARTDLAQIGRNR